MYLDSDNVVISKRKKYKKISIKLNKNNLIKAKKYYKYLISTLPDPYSLVALKIALH